MRFIATILVMFTAYCMFSAQAFLAKTGWTYDMLNSTVIATLSIMP